MKKIKPYFEIGPIHYEGPTKLEKEIEEMRDNGNELIKPRWKK